MRLSDNGKCAAEAVVVGSSEVAVAGCCWQCQLGTTWEEQLKPAFKDSKPQHQVGYHESKGIHIMLANHQAMLTAMLLPCWRGTPRPCQADTQDRATILAALVHNLFEKNTKPVALRLHGMPTFHKKTEQPWTTLIRTEPTPPRRAADIKAEFSQHCKQQNDPKPYEPAHQPPMKRTHAGDCTIELRAGMYTVTGLAGQVVCET
jgi:hypothetical protein